MGLRLQSPPAVLPALSFKPGWLSEAVQQLYPSAPPCPHHTTLCKTLQHAYFSTGVEYS